MIKQAVIFCGGYGKRLLPITNKIPKPMVLVNKVPFLSHLIYQCKRNGIKKILLLCGYKHQIIRNYFGTGKSFGLKIEYHYNPPTVETFKRIYEARSLLKQKFLLLYSDNYSSLNINQLLSTQKKNKSKLLITICEKKNGNVVIEKKSNKLKSYSLKRSKKAKFVEIGYMIVNKNDIIQNYKENNFSFNFFIKKMVDKRKTHYFYNDTGYQGISDIERLKITRNYFKNNIILIDRDGVLNLKNKSHFYVRNLNELKINYNFLKKFKNFLKEKKLICISNQAGVATNDLTKPKLRKINNKIIFYYRKYDIKIKDFFISYAHFTSNDFNRKPNHGLFLKASKKHKFILDRTCYIGDDIRDIEASYRAKTKCVYIGKKKLNNKQKNKYKFTLINKNLLNERQ